MSMRIALDNPPEFYTNLDAVAGQVILSLNRPEQVGSIVVKLEGEAITGVRPPNPFTEDETGNGSSSMRAPAGASNIVTENHKVLYKVQQVFPDDYHSSTNNPFGSFPLNPGQHSFPFKFKLPINNACSDPQAMASIAAAGISGAGMFGARGIRLMDGTKQLYLRHVTKTLPPSLSGVYNEAEIRYYVKVTVQRPGLLKENWRFQLGFKFLPIEPPRPQNPGQEAFARRPFAFSPRPPSPVPKKRALFSKGKSEQPQEEEDSDPQSVEMSARLPHPPILTCNRPVPLRLIAKKLADNKTQVYLTSFQMDLIGNTMLSSHGMTTQKSNRWVIASHMRLEIPLVSTNKGDVGSEVVVPESLWQQKPLPNTVAPSFAACNIVRRYELQILLSLRLGKPSGKSIAETISLPLHFSNVEVFSGIQPPPELLAAATNGPSPTQNPPLPPRQSVSGASSGPAKQQPQQQQPQQQQQPRPGPPLPARRPVANQGTSQPPIPPAEEYEDAPPSYSEAMAEGASIPFDHPRPPYSGVTDENAPSQLPGEKN